MNGSFQERVDRRGRPATANNDIELRNLQQELMDKNKVRIFNLYYLIRKLDTNLLNIMCRFLTGNL